MASTREFRWIACGVGLLAAGTGTRADVVAYDSTQNPNDGWMLNDFSAARFEPNSGVEIAGGVENDAQAADIITLAGSGRFITRFDTRFFRSYSSGSTVLTFTATLTLYTVVGDVPDQVIWAGQGSGAFPTTGSITEKAQTGVSFVPNILVPDTFAFAIAIDDRTDSRYSMGPRWATANPTVGSSPDFLLLQDSATLNWYQELPVAPHLDAKVWTIPPPATPILLGIAAAGRSRRRARLGRQGA